MQRLLRQLKRPEGGAAVTLRLSELLPDVLSRFGGTQPQPILKAYNPDASLKADRDKLVNVIAHTVQHVLDATQESGTVYISACEVPPWLDIRTEDTGCGMNQKFVEQHLFSPFVSTKGLTGMGIGAYQVREYVRTPGGDVSVVSCLSEGTQLTIRLPLAV